VNGTTVTVVKDLLLFLVGLAGIIYQTVTGGVNVILLTVFVSMTGLPSITNGIALVRGLTTASQSSPPAEPRSSTDSPNGSTV
jgi:hypothetical protein